MKTMIVFLKTRYCSVEKNAVGGKSDRTWAAKAAFFH